MKLELKALLAVLLVTGLLLIPSPVHAEDWFDTYNYRKLINITGSPGSVTNWTSPTSDNDPNTSWTNEGNIWDDNEATYGYNIIAGDSWGYFIELNHSAISCDKVRINATRVLGFIGQIDVDVHYDGENATTWHDVFNGTNYTHNVWTTKNLPDGNQTVDAARIRMYNDYATAAVASIYEFDFGLGETTGGAGVNYTISLEVHSGSGNDSAGVVYLENHCIDFPNDIRFADDDKLTELDHWCYDLTTDPTTFWIEIADDLCNNQSFYTYYGKSGASSASDGNATFVFFDDFNDANLSGWSGNTANFAEGNGYLNTTAIDKAIYPTGVTTTNHSVEAKMKLDSDARGQLSMRMTWSGDGNPNNDAGYIMRARYPNDDLYLRRGDGISAVNLNNTAWGNNTNWNDIYIRAYGSSIKGKHDTVTELTATDATYSTGVAYLGVPTVGVGYTYFDDFRIRKYVEPRPVVGTAGEEEARAVGEITYGYIIG